MTTIEVKYDGEFPNLCSGELIVLIEGKKWDFPYCCLGSGGGCSVGVEGSTNQWRGAWSITEWPEGFPEDLKEAVLDEVNSAIPHGCCGGCI